MRVYLTYKTGLLTCKDACSKQIYNSLTLFDDVVSIGFCRFHSNHHFLFDVFIKSLASLCILIDFDKIQFVNKPPFMFSQCFFVILSFFIGKVLIKQILILHFNSTTNRIAIVFSKQFSITKIYNLQVDVDVVGLCNKVQ